MADCKNASNVVVVLKKIVGESFVVIDDVNESQVILKFDKFHDFLNVEKFKATSESYNLGQKEQLVSICLELEILKWNDRKEVKEKFI